MNRVLCLVLAFVLVFGCLFFSARADGELTTEPETSATLQADPGFVMQKEALLSALYEADIATLRQALDTGLVTCQELTAYYLQRINTYNEPYNCFITMCDTAMEVARQRDQALADGTASGILFGIPIVIKDNMNLAGYYTTNGYDFSDSSIAKTDADVVSYLLSEGAVIIAKTNMSTDARYSRHSYSLVAGETKNAYSLYMSSAGSSGGSAVATSLNFAAAALGTDTNSSLRLPAAYAGCVALRPTHGLISRTGCFRVNSSRDTPGAITRTVYDQAIMLDAMTGGVNSYTANLNANALEGVRIGVLEELTYSYALRYDLREQSDFDEEVIAAFENAVEELRQCGAEVVTVSLPNIFVKCETTLYVHTADRKNAFYEDFLAVLEEYDVCAVIFPTYLSTPIRSGTDETGKTWYPEGQKLVNNCYVLSPSTKLPEITVPIGLHSLGCSIGMEIAAPRNQEQLLLDLAYSYTLRYDHRVLPEGAPDSYAEYHVGSLQDILDAYDAYLNPPPTTEPPETEPATTASPVTEPLATAPAGEPQEVPPGMLRYGIIGGATLLTCGLAALAVITAIRRRRSKIHTE